ncbi:hypothetical protein LCGC14_2543470 [marine sediment metagenome]|uniref:Uncharacterized protein n=1 Tax=marine sediment metagenome TaxID=412755 RepID=A0A0F9D1J4_9ZZZZ
MGLHEDVFDIIGDTQGRKGRLLPGSKDTFEVSGGEGLHGITLEDSNAPFLFNPKLHTASRTPGKKDSVTLRPAKTTQPSIRTVGQLRKVAQALKGVPEALRTKILSRLTGIEEKSPEMSGLAKILFKHQLEAPGKARKEERSKQAAGERRTATGVAQNQRQQSLELQKRQFEFKKETTRKQILDALLEIGELERKIPSQRAPQKQKDYALQVLGMERQKLLLKLLTGNVKITRRDN